MTGKRALARICAASSIASSVLASRPATSANVRFSTPCSLNHARPRTQAFSALVILFAATSTVRCMSSQTQPQNVHVASLTMRVLSLMRPSFSFSLGDGLDLNLDVLGDRHAAPRGVACHQATGQGAVGDEQQPRGQLLGRACLAAHDRLAGSASQADSIVVLEAEPR